MQNSPEQHRFENLLYLLGHNHSQFLLLFWFRTKSNHGSEKKTVPSICAWDTETAQFREIPCLDVIIAQLHQHHTRIAQYITTISISTCICLMRSRTNMSSSIAACKAKLSASRFFFFFCVFSFLLLILRFLITPSFAMYAREIHSWIIVVGETVPISYSLVAAFSAIISYTHCRWWNRLLLLLLCYRYIVAGCLVLLYIYIHTVFFFLSVSLSSFCSPTIFVYFICYRSHAFPSAFIDHTIHHNCLLFCCCPFKF